MGFKRWYYDLYLEKFPVISPSGQKYRVVMYKNGFGELEVHLYIPTDRKQWFKWKKVSESRYIFDESKGLYVEIAVKEVLEYEKWLEETRKREEEDKAGIREFEEWNGVIKEVI